MWEKGRQSNLSSLAVSSGSLGFAEFTRSDTRSTCLNFLGKYRKRRKIIIHSTNLIFCFHILTQKMQSLALKWDAVSIICEVKKLADKIKRSAINCSWQYQCFFFLVLIHSSEPSFFFPKSLTAANNCLMRSAQSGSKLNQQRRRTETSLNITYEKMKGSAGNLQFELNECVEIYLKNISMPILNSDIDLFNCIGPNQWQCLKFRQWRYTN